MTPQPLPTTGDVGRLGLQFSELAALLATGPGEPVDPHRVVQFARHAVPHAATVGLTLLRPGAAPRTVSHTSAVADRADSLQHALREGPCLEAAEGPMVIVSGDLAEEERWPAFGPRCAAELSVQSVLSLRLVLGGDDAAALNFYSTDPDAFDDHDVAVGSVFAPFAAVAVRGVVHEQDVSNLRTALTSSRQIGTAIGIIMAREVVSSDEAFAMLRKASQDLNRKLRDVAAEVERTGAVPQHGER